MAPPVGPVVGKLARPRRQSRMFGRLRLRAVDVDEADRAPSRQLDPGPGHAQDEGARRGQRPHRQPREDAAAAVVGLDREHGVGKQAQDPVGLELMAERGVSSWTQSTSGRSRRTMPHQRPRVGVAEMDVRREDPEFGRAGRERFRITDRARRTAASRAAVAAVASSAAAQLSSATAIPRTSSAGTAT